MGIDEQEGRVVTSATVRVAALLAATTICFGGIAIAEDIEGVQEHPLISRYPGQEIRWQQIENRRVELVEWQRQE